MSGSEYFIFDGEGNIVDEIEMRKGYLLWSRRVMAYA